MKCTAHKAAGGTEKQQYPVPTGSDLSNGSASERDVWRESKRCSSLPVYCFIRHAAVTKQDSYCINAQRGVPAAIPLMHDKLMIMNYKNNPRACALRRKRCSVSILATVRCCCNDT